MVVDFAPLASYSDFILLVVRIILGVTMIYYGLPKVLDLKSNANDFKRMGFSPGWFWGTIIAFVEFVGGLAILLGFYVWFFAALGAVHMAVGTVWKITKTDKPFTDWSYDLLLLSLDLLLLVSGAGLYSLNYFFL